MIHVIFQSGWDINNISHVCQMCVVNQRFGTTLYLGAPPCQSETLNKTGKYHECWQHPLLYTLSVCLVVSFLFKCYMYSAGQLFFIWFNSSISGGHNCDACVRVCVCACIVLASLCDIVGSIGTCLHSIFRFQIKTTRLKQYMLCIVMYIVCLICKCDLFFLFSSIKVFSIRLKK
mgnify:CR=1 FL=1